MSEVGRRNVRVAVEQITRPAVVPAIHAGEDDPDAALTATEILLPSHDCIVRGGLERLTERAIGALRHCIEHAERCAARKPAGELRGAKNGRRRWRARVTVERAELRRAADAPRVEESFVVAIHDVAVHLEAVNPSAFEKERPLLGEKRLER
jgi:hypothetical protein